MRKLEIEKDVMKKERKQKKTVEKDERITTE